LSKNTIKIFLLFHIILASAFLSIYSRPHSRLQASRWIYQHIPLQLHITNELWDDPLPIPLAHLPSPSNYNSKMLPLYDSDSQDKWNKINNILSETGYIIMSSSRLWRSIPSVPNRYPTTSSFYQQLFDEQLSFTKLIEINSYPGLYLPFLDKCYYIGLTNFPYATNKNKFFDVDDSCFYPGIYIRDDTAEEAFTVYDHPKVLIFKRK